MTILQSSPSLADLRQLFDAPPGYLNTASIGIPPRPTVAAVEESVSRWARGQASAQDYDESVLRARAAFARLSGVPVETVAAGATVSPLVGLVAAGLAPGDEVLVADGEFTSVLFPFAAQEARGVTLRSVRLSKLADSVTDRTTLVAVSMAQSADGRLVDLPRLQAATAAHGARLLLDTTQSAGWLPVDVSAVDYVVCGVYKWLLSPRGAAFLIVRPDRLEDLIPHAANWYSGDDIWSSIYGLPLRLAPDARRFDTSPAWIPWVGTAPSLELLADLEDAHPGAIHDHDVALADRLRTGLGLPTTGSAIASAPIDAAGQERLRRAGITVAIRAGQVRFAPHLYTTDADIDLALDALSG